MAYLCRSVAVLLLSTSIQATNNNIFILQHEIYNIHQLILLSVGPDVYRAPSELGDWPQTASRSPRFKVVLKLVIYKHKQHTSNYYFFAPNVTETLNRLPRILGAKTFIIVVASLQSPDIDLLI